MPFSEYIDTRKAKVPRVGGRVVSEAPSIKEGVYARAWVKRIWSDMRLGTNRNIHHLKQADNSQSETDSLIAVS